MTPFSKLCRKKGQVYVFTLRQTKDRAKELESERDKEPKCCQPVKDYDVKS